MAILTVKKLQNNYKAEISLDGLMTYEVVNFIDMLDKISLRLKVDVAKALKDMQEHKPEDTATNSLYQKIEHKLNTLNEEEAQQVLKDIDGLLRGR